MLEKLYKGIKPVINTSLLSFEMTRGERMAGSRRGIEGDWGNRPAIIGIPSS